MLRPHDITFVSDVNGLYNAVSLPNNPKLTLVLAPGTYTLTAAQGLLELQPNMSLFGVAGDRSAVVIDASQLPASLFSVGGLTNRTGPIRVGLGTNAIEWLTIRGHPSAVAGIATDLPKASPAPVAALVRVTHVVSTGSSRGIDVRNIGQLMAGRMLKVEIEDSEFSAFDAQAVKVVNFESNAQIVVVMSGNRIYGSRTGCLVTNLRSTSASVEVYSTNDTFETDALGCLIAGGIVTGSGSVHANSNTALFQAHGSKFVDNTGPLLDSGGIVALGAETPGLSNVASNNRAMIRLYSCSMCGNQNTDVEAFGARAIGGAPGQNNEVSIELFGASQYVNVLAAPSLPQAAPTNSVTVTRFGDRSVLADAPEERRM